MLQNWYKLIGIKLYKFLVHYEVNETDSTTIVAEININVSMATIIFIFILRFCFDIIGN